MTTNTITQWTDLQGFSRDPLTELLRSGPQRLIEQAVEAEFAVLLEACASYKTDDGRARRGAGQRAAGQSSTTISRLKAGCRGEYDRWQRRDLSTRRFVYLGGRRLLSTTNG